MNSKKTKEKKQKEYLKLVNKISDCSLARDYYTYQIQETVKELTKKQKELDACNE